MVKNLPAMQEIRVQSLGQKDPLEKETATHSSIIIIIIFSSTLAWRIPWTEALWWAIVYGVTRSRYEWVTF